MLITNPAPIASMMRRNPADALNLLAFLARCESRSIHPLDALHDATRSPMIESLMRRNSIESIESHIIHTTN